MKRLAILLALFASTAHADDVVFMNNGDKRAGRLISIDAQSYRIQVALPPPPGATPGAPQMFASATIPRGDVAQIEFSPDPQREALLRAASVAQIPDVEAQWTKLSPWLAVPRSHAARVGLLLGDLYLRSDDPAKIASSLDLFKNLEANAWSDDDKMSARQGRLRSMVANGQAKDAVAEAVELAAITENPAVLIEAKFILAEADSTALRKLVADNPRWEEDIYVRPEHARLYHGALDLYFYPYLFQGSEIEPAARGLWGALQVYDFVGEKGHAQECGRDLIAVYPGTKYAKLATDYIASLPESIRNEDPEKEARADNAPPAAKAEPEAPKNKSPEKKPNEKPNKKTN